jgi:dihydrofolate reductase
MGKLTMTTFVSLDGVMQAPGGPDEDTSGGFTHGGWQFPYADEEFGRFITGIFDAADAFLLGRTTYEIFAAYWPRVTDPADPVASRLNRLPKYVASNRLEKAEWHDTTILRGDVVAQIADLKRRYANEIQIHGSRGLAQTLLQHDVIDEYRLLINPVVLGHGKRLFEPGAAPRALELVESRTTSTGVVICIYRPAGKPKYGSFALQE